ncbi:polysaccharide deacetylase family protein [Algoriphagus halophytocola]|uniref:Polysaccharide deacetylase family protein n=1 Tax=Algoriphagus halophytocola TaxID=2991499 RepID=A0ABY6MMK5_9BACT|nr:polysaccharide deacetylase family protein [Algoriphagus sp. TR-M5]UZD23911.1 polysaccharide deacetylase family protein [Algoriphagus sp. TR-M5]
MLKYPKISIIHLLWIFTTSLALAQTGYAQTYAERLGFPKGKKVVIFHVDDAGMSYESNQGTFNAMQNGIASSCSVMMPCPWAGTFMRLSKEQPGMDIGLHLVLTSEWKTYRWEPLAGRSLVPGLTDTEGSFWPSVAEVLAHADPEEVYLELKAQVDRALQMGIEPTHLDSHMGTLFASPEFLAVYLKVAREYQIPVMFPGGNNKLITADFQQDIIDQLKKAGSYEEGMNLPTPDILKEAREMGAKIWEMGFPVLDDLHKNSGNWRPDRPDYTQGELSRYKIEMFKQTLETMEPGLAMIIVHCSENTENFQRFSGSGRSRQADLEAMLSPDLKNYIEEEGVILTTWREVMQRRKEVAQ